MDEKFSYTYSAPTPSEREEINSIRSAYLPRKETDLERLRALDRKVHMPPKVIAIALGIFGLLLFGLGMTLALEWGLLLWGIAVGVVGAAVMGIAYPVHRALLARRKKRYGNEIVRLSDALLGEGQNK